MSMSASISQLTSITNAMREAGSSPAGYFLGILNSVDDHNAATDIYNNIHYILDAVYTQCGPVVLQWALATVLENCNTGCILGAIYERHESDVIQWAKELTFDKCGAELNPLTTPKGGFHFNAENTTHDKIEGFNLKAVIQKSKSDAPTVWEFLDVMMDLDTNAKYQRNRAMQKRLARSADYVDGARQEHLDIVCCPCVHQVTSVNDINGICSEKSLASA